MGQVAEIRHPAILSRPIGHIQCRGIQVGQTITVLLTISFDGALKGVEPRISFRYNYITLLFLLRYQYNPQRPELGVTITLYMET